MSSTTLFDLRRGYAVIAMTNNPEVSFRSRTSYQPGHHVGRGMSGWRYALRTDPGRDKRV